MTVFAKVSEITFYRKSKHEKFCRLITDNSKVSTNKLKREFCMIPISLSLSFANFPTNITMSRIFSYICSSHECNYKQSPEKKNCIKTLKTTITYIKKAKERMKVKLQVFTFSRRRWGRHVTLGRIFGRKVLMQYFFLVRFFLPLQFLIKMAHADSNNFSMNRTCQREF